MKYTVLFGVLIGSAIILSACNEASISPEKEDAISVVTTQTDSGDEISTIDEGSTTDSNLSGTMVAVDIEESFLQREASKKLVNNYYHRGSALFTSAIIRADQGGEREALEAVVDMQSLTYTEGMSPNVLTHIKSDDFFAVETYPTATFVSTLITSTENGYDVTGDLTIIDQTHPITLSIQEKDQTTYTASFDIDRTVWGITYGSDNFFDNLGDNVINDTISYELVLVIDDE